MKLFLIRYTKIVFVFLQLHRVVNLFSGIFANLYYLSRFSAWVLKNKKNAPNDFPSKWDYQKRYPLYQRILENENLTSVPINYLEFGVAAGKSFGWFLDINKNPDSGFWGFDTFTGLPEDFGVYKKGMFNTNNQVPVIDDNRGSFLQGLFQQTLPGFLKSFRNDKPKIIMLDADLYSATLFVLASLAPILNTGDIIFFDEFSVPTQEFKALYEFQQAYSHIKLQLVGAANNFYFSCFKVV
ncbi:MAG: hypothetical protein EKK37_09460 [Sphingobacteriales bacterium]|nr:MAG: hypothetical protein EKK37_09460 [Sphingobacteriales bacterium]